MVFRKRKTNPAIETGGPKRSLSNRSRAGAFILIVIIIAGLAGLGYKKWQDQKSSNNNVVASKCERYYPQYSDMEESGNAKAFEDSAPQIESVDGYTTDTDCVFMLMRYEVLKGDTILARYFFDLFTQANAQTGFAQLPLEKKDEFIKNSQALIEEREQQFKSMAKQRGIPEGDFEKYRQDYIKNREMPWKL